MEVNDKHKDIKSRKFKVKIGAVATLLTFIFSLSTATAQEAIIAAGCNTSGSGGSISYSVGQVVYQTYTEVNVSVAEGVQQPYKILAVIATKEARRIFLSVSAFPNPATDYLTLKVENFDNENLSYQVIDMPGKILQNQKIKGDQTLVVMGNLAPATYFVKVLIDNRLIKTFKIVKN